ncbi:MAG: endonuclease MutS2 [Bilophila wadsworthia]
MDSRTIKALEFGKVLEHLAGLCVSEAGRRVSLGLFPLRDADAVNAAHTLFDEVRTWSAHSGFRLSDFPDLEGLFPHLEKAAVSPSSALLDADALWALRETLLQGRKAAQSINENGAMWPSLRDLVASMPLPEMTLSALSRCLGDDGLIKDESSPELMLVRGELRRLHLMCLRKVKDFAVQYNIAQYLQDDYMTLASDRYVLPLKSNFKGRIQGIIHDYSNTGETCYFEPLFLVEQNNRLQELKREEREEERKVLRYLTGIVQNELPFIRSAWDLLVRLDVELAKCGLAALFDGACATISPDGEDAPLSLLGARHPLLALDPQIRKQGGPHPVDLIFRPTDRALVISGGNAGGKTVCLKTLGLLAIMTLAGLPVPAAKGSVIPWWTSIHAFIGDEQSLDDHLSTFTAQIRHLGNAWEATDRRTLILLDEFGAGTDPAQEARAGSGSARRPPRTQGACSGRDAFSGPENYALTREGVRAASVLFDPGTKSRCSAGLRSGRRESGAGRGPRARAPESVLRRAEQYLLLDGQDMTAVMDRLNALAAKREGELDALKAEQQRTREKRKAVQERFERERERLIKDVRELSAKVMKDWQEGKAGHKQALKELAKVRAELHVSPEQEEAAAPAFDIAELKPGQHVMHRPWNKKAVVREVDARQNRVKLDMNGVTLWADAALLGPADAPQQQAKPKSGVLLRTTAGSDPEMSLLRLDLRGKRADQALGDCRSTSTGRCCPGARVWKSFTVAVRGPFARKCTRS